MMRPDLHLHTTASDGIYDARQLARLVQRANVTMFSVTDHDTLAALPEASDAAYDRGLAFLPGVEISTEGDDEIHILGYGVRPDDEVLLSCFRSAAEDRQRRIMGMADKLKDMGMSLPMKEIVSRAGAENSLGRPHLARAMMEQGYVDSVQQAFEQYLGKGRPAYLPRATMTASQAVSLLRERGAVPVLAHPGLIHWPLEKRLPMLKVWQEAGLKGIEVYHPANQGNYPYWERIARQRGLLVTGGSDFHDGTSSHGQIGETAGLWPHACDDAWALYRAVNKNQKP